MKLFEPITLRGMLLKNRIVMPAMQLMLGVRNRRARAFYLERAKGGVGGIIMCATSVDLGIARQLVTDPYWPKKVMEGRTEEIIPSNSCNARFKPMLSSTWKPGDPICVVNKRAGREIDT
jgi:2,4-dienoyl-CoA reductase-like NADH-dependent reductase (Old Yellow Enzyme family)